MAVNALRKNIPGAVAQLTGGDYETFDNKRSFDVQMDALAGRDRNRYFLSFQPTDTKPGPHTIRCARNPDPKHIVTARTMYWSGERQGTSGTNQWGPPQQFTCCFPKGSILFFLLETQMATVL